MDADPDGRAARERRLQRGAQSTLVVTITDCEATFDRLRFHGVAVGQAPTDQGYGDRDCSFSEPWRKPLRCSRDVAT